MSAASLWYRSRLDHTEPGVDPEQAAEWYWAELDAIYERKRDDELMKRIEAHSQATWALWECARGNRWGTVVSFNRPDMVDDHHDQDGDTCQFSGCTRDHAIRKVKETYDRTEAHNWFRRIQPPTS